jgi:hypothetical protein
MAVTKEPTDDLIKEMYARFGLAYYHSEVLHRGLCIILAWSDIPRWDLMTQPRIEEKLAHAFSLTLGKVIPELEGKMPAEFIASLKDALEIRNFLAHSFWFERAHLMFTATHVKQLIEELDSYTAVFDLLNSETSAWFEKWRRKIGITDLEFRDSIARTSCGEDLESLPSKEVVEVRKKKLRQRQRLIRVWESDQLEGGKQLVFEMQDASLWQLCDAGLGWSNFEHIEPDWTENLSIQAHLPADIIPRPRDAKPWEYEFALKDGVVLWVKPGKRRKSFRWGLGKKKPSTEESL